MNNSNPAFGTVEGLMLRPDANGNYPPIGVALTVTQAGEGPNTANPNPYDLYADPPCFVAGTLITTPSGQQRVEDLRTGDLVVTLDNGAQPIRWVGRVRLSGADLEQRPQLRPVKIARGALAPGVPARDLCLSPQHRLLLQGWKSELLFGLEEVLVPAAALLNDTGIQAAPYADGVTYLHLLFDRHEIILAEGAEVESLYAPWLTQSPLPDAARAELEALFPELFDRARVPAIARPSLTLKEGRVLSS